MEKLVKNKSYHFYASITIICWSLAYVYTRLALAHFSPFSLGFLRYLIASICLLVFVFITRMKLPYRDDLMYFVAAGAFGFFIYMLTFNKGTQNVSASTSSIMIATTPIITAFLSRLFLKQRLKTIQWLAIGIEFIGILILTLYKGIFSINIGILWLLLAAISLSCYNLIQSQLTKTYTALETTSYSVFLGTLMLAIFIPTSIQEVIRAPPNQLVYLIILGVFSSAIAYLAWSKAISLAKETASVSNYMFLTPFITTLLGFLIINERPDEGTILGGIVILTGFALYNYSSKKKSPKNNK